MNYESDIPLETARRAYLGTSFSPDRRADTERSEYAETLAADYEVFQRNAIKGGTLDLLEEEFARYRAGFRKRTLAYLHSRSGIVSTMIAGPSNFPVRRMNKRNEISHRRLEEMLDFRTRAKAAAIRHLRPDLRPIMAGDADAIDRLQAKIAKAEDYQRRCKECNSAIRKHTKAGAAAQVAALMDLNFSEALAIKILQPDYAGRIGIPSYELTNNNANIRRMKERVEQLERQNATPETELEGENGIRMEDCPPDNRVRLYFPGKPEVDIRYKLKCSGFRWAPSLGCWQAYRHPHTITSAKAFLAESELATA
jgi:hypothetical protein